jgi:hypothetical protein
MERCFEKSNLWLLIWNVISVCFWLWDVYTLFLVLIFCLDILPILYNNYPFCNGRTLPTILYLSCVLVCIHAPFLHSEYVGLYEGRQWNGNFVHWLLVIFRFVKYTLFFASIFFLFVKSNCILILNNDLKLLSENNVQVKCPYLDVFFYWSEAGSKIFQYLYYLF